MFHVLIESGHFLAEREKIKRLKSRAAKNAARAIEAAYWLIGGNQYEQALVLLDNAIELALKGELERIHPALITDSKAFADFDTLKSLFRAEFRQHPSGAAIAIPEFDLERTITFDTAFDRVVELHPSICVWRKRLLPAKGCNPKSLHALRNNIVHYDSDDTQSGQYAAAIVEIALPFLEEFFRLSSAHEAEPIRLSHLLKEWTYCHVEVARAVLVDLRDHGREPEVYALAPLEHHILWAHSRWPSPQDDLDSLSIGDDWSDFARRQKYPKTWNSDLLIEVDCPICRSRAPDQSYVPAKALIAEEGLEQKMVVPEGFQCFVCGFEIQPTELFLAKHFVPPIPTETAVAFLRDLGIM